MQAILVPNKGNVLPEADIQRGRVDGHCHFREKFLRLNVVFRARWRKAHCYLGTEMPRCGRRREQILGLIETLESQARDGGPR